jgi:hypothetical protein
VCVCPSAKQVYTNPTLLGARLSNFGNIETESTFSGSPVLKILLCMSVLDPSSCNFEKKYL